MLRPLGKIYGRIANVRNYLYDRGIFKSYSLGARAISIGNITTGGTGKTPLVMYVAEILADAGEKVCILTRGYGRESSGRVLVSDGMKVLVDARTGGDEPVEIARKLIGKAIVVADADRVSAAAWAKEKFGVTAFVLDDAFQHRRAKRDLDIVCIDATDPFGGGRVLPAGRLREPVDNLKRADLIVVTRSDLANDAVAVRNNIAGLAGATPIFLTRSVTPAADRNSTAFAFCGIGNPDSFFELLRRSRYKVKGSRAFPDHYAYTQQDVAALELEALEAGANELLTTSKDMVKLEAFAFEVPCRAVEMSTEIDDAEEFRRFLTSS